MLVYESNCWNVCKISRIILGLGNKPRCRSGRCGTRRGKGLLGDLLLLSLGGKPLANFAIDKEVDYAKTKINSYGTGLIWQATPKQSDALIRIRALKTRKIFKELADGVRQPCNIRRKSGCKATPV